MELLKFVSRLVFGLSDFKSVRSVLKISSLLGLLIKLPTALTDSLTKACLRATIFPALINIVILLTNKYNHEKN